MEFGFEFVAVKPKRPDSDVEPVQQSMRQDQKLTRAPSNDQKKARRELSRGQQTRKTATEESRMPTEAELLAKMAAATTLVEQRSYRTELENLRLAKTQALRADRELDLSNTVTEARFPRLAETTVTQHTAATDWMDEIEPSRHDVKSVEQHMRATANVWFDRTPDAVKVDMDEMTARSHGIAKREASQYGAAAEAGYEAFVSQIEHLHARFVARLRAEADVTSPDPRGSEVVDTGSSLPKGVTNQNTFDTFSDSINTPDTQTTKSDSASLSEGDEPEPDNGDNGIDNPAAYETHDKAGQGDTTKDYLDGQVYPSSTSKGETFSSRRVQADDQKSTERGLAPSLNEGDAPEGDEAQPVVEETWGGLADASYDRSGGAQTATDYLDGTTYPKRASADCSKCGNAMSDAACPAGGAHTAAGDAAGASHRPVATLAQIAASIEADEAAAGRAVSSAAVPYLAAMKTLATLQDSIGGISGDKVVRYFLKNANLVGSKAAQHIAALNEVLAGDVPEAFKDQWKKKDSDSDSGEDDKGDSDSGDDSDDDDDDDSKSSDKMPDFIKDKIEDKKSSRRTAADGQTCSVCGDKIAKDPDGTYHHDNGEKHDHEAKPGGDSDSKTSASKTADKKCPDCNGAGKVPATGEDDQKDGYVDCPTCKGTGKVSDDYSDDDDEDEDDKRTSSKTASTYCPNHGVYVGKGNQEQHDHCKTEQRESKDSSIDNTRLAAFRAKVQSNLSSL